MVAHNKTTLVIFAIVVTLGILTISTLLTIQPAHALTKFFNCTTAVANKTRPYTSGRKRMLQGTDTSLWLLLP
jgi:hypothetical protein